MASDDGDVGFTGSVPRFYEEHLVPMVFEPHAADLAGRAVGCAPTDVLEVAAGTGVVTRELARRLPPDVEIVATDLNQPMLDHAAAVGTARPVQWQQADVVQLPFADESFDLVVCQFAVMFFPDRPAAYAEIARVLRPGGTFLFNTWGPLDTSDFASVVTEALGTLFPDDPPLFLDRTPHGYFDAAHIRGDLAVAGFGVAEIAARTEESRARSAHIPAVAYCQGTPLRNEIEARDPALLDTATATAAAAIRDRFGDGEVVGTTSSHVVTATRSPG